jgi:acetyl-CoA carboxylase carboxyltransferase component
MDLAVMGVEGAVDIVYVKEINGTEDAQSMRQEKIEEYREKFSNPYHVAKLLHVDAVIDPSLTRHYLKLSLNALKQKSEVRTPRKHGNMPV